MSAYQKQNLEKIM